MIPALRLRKGDALAVLSVEPTAPGAWLVRVARGADAALGSLSSGQVYGPFETGVVGARFAEVEALLRAEGYGDAFVPELTARLVSKDRGQRARAAIMLGWRGNPSAVPLLLDAADAAKDEIGAILEGLTRIGGPDPQALDPRVVALGRKYAERKLLSRRRSGVELLHALGDEEGLLPVRKAALERLPDPLRGALSGADRQSSQRSVAAPLLAAIEALPIERRGVVLDVLYELNEPLTVALCRAQLEAMNSPKSPVRVELPHVLRYTKSVLKRAMLRGDAVTFGEVVHALDLARRRTTGKTAKVKSGLDGEERSVRIFSPQTQRWIVRAALRHLRRVAKHRPDAYALTAAELLARYTEADLAAFSESIVVHTLLHGRSTRHKVSRALKVGWKSAALAKAAPAEREEPFPELWDRQPRAYLRLLEADAEQVVNHGLWGIARHPDLVRTVETSALTALMRSRFPKVISLARSEIERRFEQALPDVSVLVALLEAGGASTELGLRLFERGASGWLSDPPVAVRILSRRSAEARAGLSTLAARALGLEPSEVRSALAKAMLDRVAKIVEPRATSAVPLDDPEIARLGVLLSLLCEVLAPQLEALVSLEVALRWLSLDGVDAPDVVPYRMLGATRAALRPEDAASIPAARLIRLASDPLNTVRHAAHRLISSGTPSLSLLFQLIESPLADTRALAGDRLAALPPESLGLEGVSVLLDSVFSDVQARGKALLLAHPSAFDASELLFRLAESPHPAMRRFGLELAESHLRHGLVPLMRIEGFARAVLLDAHPDRATKQRLLELLVRRGLESEDQAVLVAGLLSSVVRTRISSDFDRVLSGLARLNAAYPGIPSALSVSAP